MKSKSGTTNSHAKVSDRLAAYDENLRTKYGPLICGVDEVGRGAYAGPIAAGACVLPPGCVIEGLNDSKQLVPEKREELIEKIKAVAVAWSVIFIEAPDIDTKGLTWANSQAMQRAAKSCSDQMGKTPDVYVVDQAPYFPFKPHIMISKGDSTSLAVAAASVLAKVTRDAMMVELGSRYPQYGFEDHKGYINDIHKEAVRKHGLIEGIHRKSYKVSGIKDKQITLADFL